MMMEAVALLTCIDTISCLPKTPLEVFHLFDVFYGPGTTVLIYALILGIIELGLYIKTKSLALLAVLGIYTIAMFGVVLSSSIIGPQLLSIEAVLVVAVASVITMMALKFVKE